MTIKLTDKERRFWWYCSEIKARFLQQQYTKMLPDIDLVTIYRNLDAFAKEKLIKRVSLGTDEALYEYQPEPHHHAICSDCEKVIHFKAPDAKIIKLLGLEGFDIDELEVTVRGKCKVK